jgi:spermidine/putrescine transport system ATP-binding protein
MKVSFTIRPEKIAISTEKPSLKRNDINLFEGIVDEPIYSGFQTKFYVRISENAVLKVMKQHSNYSDEGLRLSGRNRCIFPGVLLTAT